MKETKEKHCLYCGGTFKDGNSLFCSVGCKSKYDERERHYYIRNIDKNWK